MKKILLVLFFLCTQLGITQGIRTQRITMEHEQLPLSPVLNPERSYYVGIDSDYVSYAREIRRLTIEQLEYEDNTVGRFIGRSAMRSVMNKDTVEKLIEMRLEERMRSLRDLKRAYYPYDKWVVRENVYIKGYKKAAYIEQSDFLFLIKPNEAKFRVYERTQDGHFSFDIKGRLSAHYTLLNKKGDTLYRDHFIARNYGIASTKWYPHRELLQFLWEEMPNNPDILNAIDDWHRDAFEKLTQNLTTELSNRYGHFINKRVVPLYRIKPRKYDYIDFEKALANLSKGLTLYLNKPEESTKELEKSIQGFENILVQHEPGKRKQRIDIKVAGAVQYNMAEAYYWLGNYSLSKQLAIKIIQNNLGYSMTIAARRLIERAEDTQNRIQNNENLLH